MKKVKFVFALHNHQPVGNFGHVYEEAYQKSYLPLVEALREYPDFRFNLHYTGDLFAWLDREHPDYMGMLREMVQQGQVEMLTGGYYEPILALLPDADKVGQILKLSDYIEKRFGRRPTGMWLAERVWEPHLPAPIAAAGVDYVVVDDFHFKMAGLRDEDLTGYYVTEEQGHALKVFPGSERLRYTLPFMEPEETIKYFKGLLGSGGGCGSGHNPLAAMADDGEKFGVWPGTHKWVYKDGWLKRFMKALAANSDWVEPTTFGDYIKEEGPMGRFYLPTSSYMEMGEWSLPPAAMREYDHFVAELNNDPEFDLKRLFVKGGFFRNFLYKYPESNAMHKRMLQVSAKVHRALAATGGSRHERDKMLDALYQGQCNDAFWHGVFGGLYLPHLRDAVYRGLIKAEEAAERILAGESGDPLSVEVADMDGDLAEEVFVTNGSVALLMKPSDGGTLTEFDFRPVSMNLMDNLSRTEEAYHDKIKDAAHEEEKPACGAAKTIHDAVRVKEKGLSDYLVYDWYRRASLIDHFLGPDAGLDDFRRCRYDEAGDFVKGAYTVKTSRTKERVKTTLERLGVVSGMPVRVVKTIVVRKESSGFEADYEITNEGTEELNAAFGVEFNFSLQAGDAFDRYFEIPGHTLKARNFASSGELNNVRSVRMVDDWLGYEMELSLGHESALWRFPVETVSQSEAGYERVFQSSCLTPVWRVSLAPGVPWKVRLGLNIKNK